MPGYFTQEPRPIAPEDAAGAHQLLRSRLGVTPYIDRAVEVLSLAERGGDPEHRAWVVARDRNVAGLALFGAIAGTDAGYRIHALVIESHEADVGERLLESIASILSEEGGRYIVAELADDPAMAGTITLARRGQYEEVGRIPDYFRDGVPLVILRRDLSIDTTVG